MIKTSATRLKNARTAKGLTQSEVAAHMNRSVSTIKHWEMENGTSPGNLDDIAKLCDLLDISTDYYITGHQDHFTRKDLATLEHIKSLSSQKRELIERLIEHLHG